MDASVASYYIERKTNGAHQKYQKKKVHCINMFPLFIQVSGKMGKWIKMES
jgi:hypothetical protein